MITMYLVWCNYFRKLLSEKYLLLSVCVILFFQGPIQILEASEQIHEWLGAFKVIATDGQIEKYGVKLVALAEFATWEDGGPAEPFNGKFYDDRECHWSVNSQIVRTVYMMGRPGKLYPDPNKKKVYTTDFTNNGASFVFSTFSSENCNDAASRRESDFNDARSNLREAMRRMALPDFNSVKSEYSKDGRIEDVHWLDFCYSGIWNEDVSGKLKWTFDADGLNLRIFREDGFVKGIFNYQLDQGKYTGQLSWGNGEQWSNVILDPKACDEIRTNQVWYYKR